MLMELRNRIAREAADEQDRWILWVPVALGVGIQLYFGLRFEPSPYLGPIGAIGAFVGVYLSRKHAVFMLTVLVFVIGGIGFSMSKFRSDFVAAPILSKPMGPVTIEGRVVGIEAFPDRPRIRLTDLTISRSGTATTPTRILLRIRGKPNFEIGDFVLGRVKLLPPPGPVQPGAYDFQRRSWFQGVGAIGFTMGRISRVDRHRSMGLAGRFEVGVAAFRRDLSNRIISHLEGVTGAVAAALIVGDRSAIPPDVTQAMRDSGLAHLLAISGLHIGIVASLIFGVVRFLLAAIEPLAINIQIKKLAAGIALCGSFAYLLIAGATLPTQRAFIMGALVLGALLLDRKAISMRLVALAATAILMIAPESLLSASFQLSFAAVVALVAVYEASADSLRRFTARPGIARRVIIYFSLLAMTTIVAGVATGFVAYYHFGRITHFGLVANLLAVPVTAIWIMPMGVLACLSMPFGVEGPALGLMGDGIDVMIHVARAVAGWPGAVTTMPAMPSLSFAIMVAGGLWLCLMQRRWCWAGLGVFGIGALLIPFGSQPDILISESGKLMALKLADGRLVLSRKNREKFVAESWLRENGQAEKIFWRDITGTDNSLRCDPAGCIYRSNGHRIAFVRDISAVDEDCRLSVLVVSPIRIGRRCRRITRVIDFVDLRQGGAHTVRLEPEGTRVLSVNADRGDRPWVPRRR